MAVKNVTPIKRSEKTLESREGKVLVRSVDVVLSEPNVQEALLLYRQNRVYAFVNKAVNLWTDWRVFTRLAFIVSSRECTEHGDRSDSFVNLTDEIQKPFRQRNTAILKSVEYIIHDSLMDHFHKNDSEAILCYALLAIIGIIDNTTNQTEAELLEKSVELGCIEANVHLAKLLSHTYSKELYNRNVILPIGRKIVELERQAAEAGFAYIATQIGYAEEAFLKIEYSSQRRDYWNQIAARAGNTMSMVDIGEKLMRENKKDQSAFNVGLKMIQKAYELGSPTAAYKMGRFYADNSLGAKNPEKAMFFFETAKSWKKRELNLTLAGTNLAFKKMRDLDQCIYSVDDAIDELQHSIPSKSPVEIPDGHNDGHDESENVYFIHDYIRRMLGYNKCCDLIREIAKHGPDTALHSLDKRFLAMKDNFVVMTDYWCGVETPLFQWSVRDQAFSCRFRGEDMPYWGEDWQSTPPPPQMPKSVAHAIMEYLNRTIL